MISKLFKIANLTFKIIYPEAVTPPDNFLLFECENIKETYTYQISITDKLPSPEGDIIARREDIVIYRNGEYETRLLAARGTEGYYALYRELPDDHCSIFLDRSYSDLFSLDTVFSSLFALERRLLSLGGFVLHCAYLNHKEKAILFSAPSGAGKSTQAGLWEKYRGSKTENGDRALIIKEDGKWFACGWPVCGSSEICNNTKHQILTVVTLDKATDNSIRPLSGMQAFSKLYSEVTVNSWDKKSAVNAMDLLEDFVKEIPVYHLACDISEKAVETLESMISDL
ncbi:MAG: hypothetical protein K6F00_06870 [Lachnospiraceae bacterium]|nr:hypothetical protein [Lachnospiraceae bacterium]